jgi:hypothetical protein
MSDDFRKLIQEIEAEAKAEGPAAEAELRALRREFSVRPSGWHSPIGRQAQILSAARPCNRRSFPRSSSPGPLA